MNVILVWAWMLWSADAVEHERYYGGPRCSGQRMQSNMNVFMVCAWMT